MSIRISKTKHFHISKILAERLKYQLPGELLPTVAEMMKEFNASQVTISQALSRLRGQGLIYRPPGKKRLVVAQLADRSLFRIVLIRPTWPSPDFDAILYAIQQEGANHHLGFDVFNYTSMDSLDLERALGSSDSALFISSSEPFPDHLKNAINSSRKPVVFLREKPEGVNAAEISVDNYNIGRMAVNYLAELGHRKILAMTSEPPAANNLMRLNGWRDGMRELGLENPEQLYVDASVRPGQYSIIGSYERMRYWLAQHPEIEFTAVFCMNWTGALAASRAFLENNLRVPEDVSLMTCGGEGAFSDFLNPPLTTIEFDIKEFARYAIETVQEALKNPKSFVPCTSTVKSFLVQRRSTRALRATAGTSAA